MYATVVSYHVPHHVHSRILEEFEYSSVCSVNEEEPPTTHSLIFNLPHHVSPVIPTSLCPQLDQWVTVAAVGVCMSPVEEDNVAKGVSETGCVQS